MEDKDLEVETMKDPSQWLSPRAKAWLEKNLLPARRRQIEILLMMAGIFLAGFLAFKDEHAERLKAEARLNAALQAIAPRITFMIKNTSDFIPTVRTGDKYLKVLVRYNGPGTAICGVFLTDLEAEGDPKPIFTRESYKTGAENGGEPKYGFMVFPFSNGAEHYYNIAWIANGDNELKIQSKEYNDTYSKPLLIGVYKFTIKTSGENCPTAYAEVWIRYSGGSRAEFITDRFRQL